MPRAMIPLVRAAKYCDLAEHDLRRALALGVILGEKVGRDWFLPSAEVARLAREYPIHLEPLGGVPQKERPRRVRSAAERLEK